ncbi:hypothetical protein H0176_13975 [Methylorubrum populi]|uniref:Uncharacterized protein n=1 Tax=Methylorubrum rhodesianum TaxID=29427 RepID=A0ABU9Z5H2_9HYPH|nr:hypothetical protein [Methylorubrum rhodesianum]MBK3402076.1 hypothetical protein [Methylorubrum rhodesianum]MBY0141378.1 hypothetical protein [Methylorubrum populi]
MTRIEQSFGACSQVEFIKVIAGVGIDTRLGIFPHAGSAQAVPYVQLRRDDARDPHV